MISSVVVRFPSTCDTMSAMQQLATQPQASIGELIDGRSLPVTLEADSSQELEALHDWVRHLPGVEFVDVVFVYFDHATAANEKVVQLPSPN